MRGTPWLCDDRAAGVGRERGFTLIELLVTLAIIGILSTVAVPSMRAFVVNNRLANAADAMYMGLAQARSEAMRLNTWVGLMPVDGVSWASGWSVTAVTNACAPTGSVIVQHEALGAGVAVKAANSDKSFTASSPNYVFAPSGFPYTTCPSPYYGGAMNARIAFLASETGREKQVILSKAGRARVCDTSRETCSAD